MNQALADRFSQVVEREAKKRSMELVKIPRPHDDCLEFKVGTSVFFSGYEVVTRQEEKWAALITTVMDRALSTRDVACPHGHWLTPIYCVRCGWA